MNIKKFTFGVFIVLCVLLISSVGVVAQEDETRTINIEITESGDAYWVIDIKQTLNTDDDVESFNDWISELENNNELYTNEQRENFASIIERAEQETERNMDIENVSVSAHKQDESIGVTQIKFEWTGFSKINDNRNIEVGDIFYDGYNLDDSEKLILKWDDSTLRLVDSQYNLQPSSSDTNSISWVGEGEFSENEPYLEFNDEDTTNDDAPGFGFIIAIISITSMLLLARGRT